ncbi:hypothetical protein [Streptomyces sp. NPDC002088]|uniref:hypothetical protein n=1 Tax=Streptomyces sp. NPDC002088 TaxID=3154665 RepID=UPI00332572A6
MKQGSVVWSLATVGVVTVLTVSCANTGENISSGGTVGTSPAPSRLPYASDNYPALAAAADEVDGIVHPRYEKWYAGMVLDHQSRTMTLYRKPGGDLDRQVRSRVSGVKVVFKDAAMSEKEMTTLVKRILADAAYWRGMGIVVTGGGPLRDGSGVSMMTRAGTSQEATRLSRYYDSHVVVERGSAIAPPADRFTPSPSAT